MKSRPAKHFLAMLIGCVVVALILGALEAGLRLFNPSFQMRINTDHRELYEHTPEEIRRSSELRSTLIAQSDYPKWQLSSSLFKPGVSFGQTRITGDGRPHCCVLKNGLRFNENTHARALANNEDTVIYDVQYSFDQFGRRKTFHDPAIQKSTAIIMLGDSFTLGEGVQDDETASAFLAKRRPDTRVYNMGVSAGGPGQILYELMGGNPLRFQGIKEPRKIFIYTYMDHHMDRIFCRSTCYTETYSWIQDEPYFIENNDGIEFKGSFHNRSFWINQAFNMIGSSRLMQQLGIAFPPRFMPQHYRFLGKMMQEIDSRLHQKFNEIEFYVAIFPGLLDPNNSKVIRATKDHNIKILDYTWVNMSVAGNDRAWLPKDGHPSPIGHYIYAYLLDRDLPK